MVSLLVTVISHRLLHPDRPGMIFNPLRWGNILLYLCSLVYVEILSHIDVLKRILTGEIRPAIVEVDTKLRTDSAKMVLGNSITLTPGTLTLRVGKEGMFVHTLGHDRKKRIGEMFERYWGRASRV
jgi:multicomponent Na+:H+ antiporter subunit E